MKKQGPSMTKENRFPSASSTHQEHLVRPQHTNAHNTLFGGELVAWVDLAAAACAMRHCGRPVVTASIDAMHFLAPIRIGWLVSLKASVNFTNRSSCEVGVRVSASNPVTGDEYHTASAYLTFVALDVNGKPTAIPAIECENDKDRERLDAAKVRRKARLALKEELKRRRS
jgi:acyl-CoA hydrolase